MLRSSSSTPDSLWDVLIIGAGFAGLALALALQRQDTMRFVVLEQGDSPGGTWRDNRYPGCACDVPSHLYSLSSGPAWDWPRRYGSGRDIEAYLKQVASSVAQHIRYRHGVRSARWDEERQCWQVECAAITLQARVLINATGPLTEPALPPIDGLETFAGPVVHSARWPASLDLDGRRVALIGTGASAIQIAPAIVAKVAQLTIFQRNAPWVVARADHAYAPRWRQLWQRFPWTRKLYRSYLYWRQESRGIAFMHPRIMAWTSRSLLRQMQRQISEASLRQRVTPTTPMGCQRILLADDWWSTLQQPHVTLTNRPIARVTPVGLIDDEGTVHGADVLLLATGFRYQDNPMAERFMGRHGKSLAACWHQQRGAFFGMMLPDFPNFFLMTGPHSGLGHNSILFMIEAQVKGILRLLKLGAQRGSPRLCVRPAVYHDFLDEMNRRSQNTPWMQGCQSWYLDSQGRNTALWPGYSFAYWWRVQRIKIEDVIDD